MADEEGKDKNSETARPKTWELGGNKAETGRKSSHRNWCLVLVENDENQQRRGESRGDSRSFELKHLSTGLGKMESSLAFFDGD